MDELENRRRYLDELFVEIFDYILCLAADHGKKAVPTETDVLFCDFVNALLEYITGEEKKLGLYNEFFLTPWEEKSNRLLTDAMEKFGGKFSPDLKDALLLGLNKQWRSSRGDSWYSSQLDTWLRSWDRPTSSTFHLTVPFVERRKKSAEVFDKALLRHCEEIAKFMQKYMEQDVAYIRAHYHW